MRVIGIDPGSRSLGYGVVEERRGRLVHVAHGVIRASPHARLEQRLQGIFSALLSAIALHHPDAAAVEGVFAFRNPRSALILGQARCFRMMRNSTSAKIRPRRFLPRSAWASSSD